MPEVRRGRISKAKRNISGLRNQRVQEPLESNTESRLDRVQPSDQEEIHESDKLQGNDNDTDQDWDPLLEVDSLKLCWKKEDQAKESENDNENMEILTEGWDDGIDEEGTTESLHIRLMKLAIADEDDPRDEEWIPAELRKKYLRKTKEHKERPTVYKKGPHVGSTSERTRRRY
ncbi:hypothetical protein J132_00564 [Termitomyces sp. J132]|nr:hypothetical protein J132_00564 [Termitomyces sp. J132]